MEPRNPEFERLKRCSTRYLRERLETYDFGIEVGASEAELFEARGMVSYLLDARGREEA